MKPIRVLVVDDSGAARALIRALLESEPGLSVCGEGANGREALELTLALKPDVITLDLQMPEMDGLTAIEEIMAVRATPILVLSDLADSHHAMEAVARGALEAAAKPGIDDGGALAQRLRMLAGVPVIRHIRRQSSTTSLVPQTKPALQSLPLPGAVGGRPENQDERLIAIASSTGGPQALAALLPQLPATLAAPILIVQHLSVGFAAAMADWLDGLCPLQVVVAKSGERPQPGRIYLADPAQHLILSADRRLRYVEPDARDIYHPSCDRLLSSVAEHYGKGGLGVILTGMGRDGVRGLLDIRAAGGWTLAQDEASSLIFGMNREAILAGAIAQVLPLDQIAGALCRLVGTLP
ncbi:chemotaxis-specific protein-glutamate methyltransferase CheB [Thermochromatium tepidum]|uniref:Protein-glutamate methylesterase/protein-glutamine glutaminase n=1 Tax=Thermochromatium tepidum ATCC 43061 TaxID=316276 RepID=A0A6I6E3Y1_THETI|nr:chemotaxis-specific protein-glutamate methyltransferase CheB [Thermochromatium tepidum]QGU32462.1 chemotaxis-specific protein-glutamate methyltransferase CheB [Thermochromatium tepidum ATCC 43061]